MRAETFPLHYMFGFRFKIILRPVQPFYHYPGQRWYMHTKHGKLIDEAEAKAEGDRPTHNGQ